MLRPEPSTLARPPALHAPCRVVFGAPTATIEHGRRTPVLAVALPVLSGAADEIILPTEGAVEVRDGCVLFEAGDATAGFAVAPPDVDLETAARDLYRQLFAATRGRRLYRVWNYVPGINAVNNGLENYRLFCRGRGVAFEDQFGIGYQRQLPAASAVGVKRGPLAIAFLAGDATPRHFENPQQVPAFEYPADYGPRPPSFSRATLVDGAAGRQLFVSGTAAIRGHASIAIGDLAGQLACTRENLHVIAATAGAGADFGAIEGWRRMIKVYVRHARDFSAVQRDLEQHLLRADDVVTYLQADLCRADLLVEIEAVLTRECLGRTADGR